MSADAPLPLPPGGRRQPEWAARFAAACRCAQEVREIMFDPLV